MTKGSAKIQIEKGKSFFITQVDVYNAKSSTDIDQGT